MSEKEKSWTLYRLYGPDEQALYIGLSIRPFHRLEEHGNSRSWWNTVACIKFDRLPPGTTYAEARQAERIAIESELPPHNMQWNPQNHPRTSEAFGTLYGRRIAEVLRERRRELGLQQHEVASMISCQTGLISRYETGRALPPPDRLQKLCRLYELDTADTFDQAYSTLP